MKSFFLVPILSILLTYSLFSQSLEEYKRKYNNAKELYKRKNYELAMEAFRQVASERPNNPYFQYASYFYSLSASKVNRYSEALLMIAQIENKYPTWNKLNEVRLLAADIYFKQKKYKEAFTQLNKLGKSIPDKEIKGMALVYLNKIHSTDSLKQLNKIFPDNPYIGETLASRLINQSATTADQDLLKRLVKTFQLDTAAIASTVKFESKKKSTYNVALLFPFILNELNPESPNRSNFYAIDMYEGMRLGVEALQKQGIKLNLFTYDVGKDNQNLAAVLSKKDLKGMDLIIGPLTNSPQPTLDNFLSENRIFGVNPVGNYEAINANAPLLYLSEPVVEVQGRKAGEYIYDNYLPKSSAIFYGATPKDSIIAFNYHDFLVSKGVEIIAFNKVTRGNVSLLSTVLSDSLNYGLENIFMSSTEQSVAANFVSEVEKNGYKCPVVASPQWLQFSFFNLDQFKRLNYYFIYPDFVDYSLPATNEFREAYKKNVNIIPSEFSFIGFDLINFFGKALWQYGTNFQQGIISQGFTPGVTLSGYNFSVGNSNDFVPLVKFEDEDLKVINSQVK